MHFISNTEWQIDDQMYTRGTFEKTERECWKLAKVFLILSPRQLFIILYSSHSHIHPHTHAHTCRQTPTDAYMENTSTMRPVLLKVLNGFEWLAQWFTSKGPFTETLLDAIGSADMEGLGDLLVHEALSVENIGHHHPQVKHLQ